MKHATALIVFVLPVALQAQSERQSELFQVPQIHSSWDLTADNPAASAIVLRGHDSIVQLRILERLRQSEIDHLGDWFPVMFGHQHIARLDVTMDDSFLVGMLDGLTDWDGQFQSLARGKTFLITVASNRNSFDQFHYKNGRPESVAPA